MPSDRGIAVLGTSEDILKSLAEELSNLQPAQDVYYIDNKYYSASVPIRFDSDVEGMSQGVEALVVVIEADSKDFLFDRFAPWWEDTLALQHDASVEISLVFCRDMHMGEKEHAPFLMQARDWCVDQGFELIEGQRYDEDGIADCETGVVRLEDALQAHVWPGAVMKSRVHGGTRIVTEDDGDDDDDDDDIDDDDDDDDADDADDADRLVMESIFRRMGTFLHLSCHSCVSNGQCCYITVCAGLQRMYPRVQAEKTSFR